MRLREISVGKGLDRLTAKLCDLHNHYILRMNEDDLNPNVPLLTEYDQRKNRVAGESYALLGLGMGITGIVSMIGGIKEFADMVYHYEDLGAVVKDFGMELSYLVLAGISSSFVKQSGRNLKILQRKRQIDDGSPEPA